MPKSDLARLECEFCGNHVIINIRDSADKVLPVVAQWRGVMTGDAPPSPGADNLHWYDTLECLIAGERQHDARRAEQEKKQAELNATLDRANEALKRAKPQLVTS